MLIEFSYIICYFIENGLSNTSFVNSINITNIELKNINC